MPASPTDCDRLIQGMWCDQDCATVFGILSNAHSSSARQPLSAADNNLICTSSCYFSKYHDYLQRVDKGTCVTNLETYRPPNPYVPPGYLPGNLPSNGLDFSHFAEAVCIRTESVPESHAEGYCVDIISTAAVESNIESECSGIPIDTNFTTWQCENNCPKALTLFILKSGCCLYSLEYARYAMAGYPLYVMDLAEACGVTGNLLGLQQPCAGALTSTCGSNSVCLGSSETYRTQVSQYHLDLAHFDLEHSLKLARMQALPYIANCSNGTWTNVSEANAIGPQVQNCTDVPYVFEKAPAFPRGYQLSNGIVAGEGDLCVCTGVNHQVENVSGSLTCVDKDECLLGVSACHGEATCINTVGSYVCQCNDGFEGDGKSCMKRPCDPYVGRETCILCGEDCCHNDMVDPPVYNEIVHIGCRSSAEDGRRDLNKRIVSTPSRHDNATCLENVSATLSDCVGNESLGAPCALWAKNDYFCVNLTHQPQHWINMELLYHQNHAEYSVREELPYIVNCTNGTWTNQTQPNGGNGTSVKCTNVPYASPPAPFVSGWGQTQFWCLRKASGGMCDLDVQTVLVETDGIGLKAQAKCQADGTYNASIECERVTCGRFEAPANGMVDGEWDGPPRAVSPRDMYYPESVVVNCNTGYDNVYEGQRMEGLLNSECLSDGKYSNTAPALACDPLECGYFSDSISLTAILKIYGEDSASYPEDLCQSTKATFCQEECCECLKRWRDCSADAGGCPECNRCSDCTILATACSNMCSRQAVLPPEIAEPNRSFVFGESVQLACGSGYELAAVMKNDASEALGKRTPVCTADDTTNEAIFQVGMSCLAKP